MVKSLRLGLLADVLPPLLLGVGAIASFGLWTSWVAWAAVVIATAVSGALGLGVLFLLLGGLTLAGRARLVADGVLYGAQAVTRVDVVAASLFGIGLAAIAYARARHARTRAQTVNTQDPGETAAIRQPSGWINDRLSAITAIVSAGALVISLINLFVPVQLPTRPKAACPGAQDRAAPYVGITSGENGNNGRAGPSVSYPAIGRFPRDCTIGFSHYCVGEPLRDPQGTIENVQRWRTSRWLVVAKQPVGWKADLAKLLSGEDPRAQYITDATITPATSYENLPYLGDDNCPGDYRLPAAAEISDAELGQGILKATADRAVNMGFAVWIPPGEAFIDDGNTYHQIFDGNREVGENPGSTQPDGSKKVVWGHTGHLLPERPAQPATVVVMAIPCITDNIPADIGLAAVAEYDIGSRPQPRRTPAIPAGYDAERLARAACQTNAV
ncbi:hypothetical protein ACTG9Q_12750 [Actinokineospora sp. 24-640]